MEPLATAKHIQRPSTKNVIAYRVDCFPSAANCSNEVKREPSERLAPTHLSAYTPQLRSHQSPSGNFRSTSPLPSDPFQFCTSSSGGHSNSNQLSRRRPLLTLHQTLFKVTFAVDIAAANATHTSLQRKQRPCHTKNRARLPYQLSVFQRWR